MAEPITTATLAIAGIGTVLAGIAGNASDRTACQIIRGIKDRIAGLGLPENHDVARAVRKAQVHALERLIQDYREIGRPEWHTEPHLRPDNFFDRSRAFCARTIGRCLDTSIKLNMEVQRPLLAAIDNLLAQSESATGTQRLAQSASLAEAAVLSELEEVLEGVVFPPGFETHFKEGNGDKPKFLDLFGAFIGEQIKSDDRFRAILTAGQLATIEELARDATELITKMDTRFGPIIDEVHRTTAAIHERVGAVDERTQRIESKLEGLARDETEEAAQRRWEYLQNHQIKSISFFLILKGDVGFEWLGEILRDIRLTFSREDRRLSLGALLDASPIPNTEEYRQDQDRPVSSFWEMYCHEPGYWVRKIARAPRKFSTVAGFDVVAPWSSLGITEIEKLSDLATVTEINVQIPPKTFLPGIEEFVIDFSGDTFSFSLALSDHSLGFNHEMARTFHSLGGNANIGSIGAGFSGVQLLELFLDQLRPKPKNPRKGIGVLGLSGPEGRAIAFYPKQPPGFEQTPDAQDYRFKVTIPGMPILDPAERLKELEEQIAQTPSDPEPYAELATRYERQGRIFDAIRCLENAIQRAEPSATIHGLLGETLVGVGRRDEAADHFRSAVEIEPANAAAHRALGACLLALDNGDDALPHFEKAVLLEPGAWQNHANIAYALAAREKYEESAKSYEQAIRLSPDQVDIWLRLGWVHEILERFDDALKAFEGGIHVSPDHAELHEHAGRMLMKLGKVDEAISRLQCSVELEATARCYLSLADAQVLASSWSDAEGAFRRAIELGGNANEIRYSLAAAEFNQGKYAGAQATLDDLLRVSPNHELGQTLRERIQALES